MSVGNLQESDWQNDFMENEQFYRDVVLGLTASPKYLLSKYFYDEVGDGLFQQLMASAEYYPARCEMEILKEQSGRIVAEIMDNDNPVDIIGLGPGDATKSVHLLRAFIERKGLASYLPIDISPHIIEVLRAYISNEFPRLNFHGFAGEYFEKLPEAIKYSAHRKLILFLGGNACNFPPDVTLRILQNLNNIMRNHDLLLLGFDLRKDPRIIRAAYDDRKGITARFNLNLLDRINRELKGNFSTTDFSHYSNYDPQTGANKSYLISEKDQQVKVRDEMLTFQKGEPVFMEISQKYSLPETGVLAAESGFVQRSFFTDSNEYFADVLWEKKD